MSITFHNKYRLKARHRIQGMRTGKGFSIWCGYVGKGIAVLITALLFAQYVTDRAIAEDEALAAKHRAERMAEQAESTWLSCLNNRGVYLDGKLHTCTLANTHFTKGDFK